ncbi:L-amino-acid oxidase-like [Xenia sp. Carnegie-2017]|uniref:L-amino-acid oxidase-like n=1 Tax=Xenia sp. Carnegie-2017 TaxID=2897299 RepID=UPI001F04D4B4|nr:L-amino-acid oxidase-like [Xenia sp. Carnegie-2017]
MRKCVEAMEDISIVQSTKVYIQTKQIFWENEGIKGGFSKTNLPIGQIHYLTPEDPNTKEGLVLIYTWKNEALLFGSMKEEQVKQKVMKQLAEIHPAFKEDMVTTCIVHAWYNQPSYQGAYGTMKAAQHKNIRYLWEPIGNVHFACEGISFTPKWIQGALESGLKAAFQVYEQLMERTFTKVCELFSASVTSPFMSIYFYNMKIYLT